MSAATPRAVASGRIPGVGPSLASRLRALPTPTSLKSFLYAIWIGAALLFMAGEGTLAGARQAMKTVGQDAAPSIIAAQEISSSLADLDANAGNYLLGNKTHQAAAREAFEQRRTRLTARLVDAAKNITYEAERAPIEAMVEDLGRYLELVGELRFRRDNGDAAGAVAVYDAATDLMHQRLLPAASALDKINYDELKKEYEAQQARSSGAEVVAGLVATVLLAILAWAQVFLVRRTRRILSPPLLAATLGTALFALYLITRISASREELRLAKEDAFESIHALWQARSIAYDANGDETRYLLGGARAASFEASYQEKVRRLTTEPQPSASVFTARALPASYKGYFADELRNVTFPGERDAAVEMIRAFAVYDRIDGGLRALERKGDHAGAVELCIGAGANQSNAAFDRFDQALHRTVELNREEFDKAIQGGQAALRAAAILSPLAAVLIAVLAFLGIRPRLREYAA